MDSDAGAEPQPPEAGEQRGARSPVSVSVPGSGQRCPPRDALHTAGARIAGSSAAAPGRHQSFPSGDADPPWNHPHTQGLVVRALFFLSLFFKFSISSLTCLTLCARGRSRGGGDGARGCRGRRRRPARTSRPRGPARPPAPAPPHPAGCSGTALSRRRRREQQHGTAKQINK